MAVYEAKEVASIVASYLRKHGLTNSLSAFLAESEVMTCNESNALDLETIYKSYISTQVNGTTKAEKKKAKVKDGSPKDVSNQPSKPQLEEELKRGDNTSSNLSKKKGKKRTSNDSTIVLEANQIQEEKKENIGEEEETTNELERMKKSKKQKIDKDNCNRGMGMIIETDQNEKPSSKKKKEKISEVEEEEEMTKINKEKGKSSKEKEQSGKEKEQAGKKKEQSGKEKEKSNKEKEKSNKEKEKSNKEKEKSNKENEKSNKEKEKSNKEKRNGMVELSEDGQVEPIEKVSSKKSKKEKKISDTDEKGEVVNLISKKNKKSKKEKLNNEKSDKIDDTLINTVILKADESTPVSKNKKKMKDNVVQETLQENENMATPSNGAIQKEDSVTLEMNGLNSTGAKKRKDTPGKSDLPSGALAFRRVEAEKVEFSDPRLSDNSYWAKDGAEVGYGAKAQEILGVVKGRDFRHEKTKKKRGSYRGGLIDLESHSIKFQNSDDE